MEPYNHVTVYSQTAMQSLRCQGFHVMPKRYWLVKSEPDCFSIHDLAKCKQQTTFWSGVRNYQARNFMRDQMKLGDEVLYYHSSANPPAVAGTAVIVREGYPDHTAWNRKDDHFDPKASPDNPIWQMVDIKLQEIFSREVPIDELRKVPALKNMELLKQGSRLSVQPVSEIEYEVIVSLAHQSAPKDAAIATQSPVKKATATKASVAQNKKPTAKKATPSKRVAAGRK
jgi:predicted RNA-binding protein with PUA-like domain